MALRAVGEEVDPGCPLGICEGTGWVVDEGGDATRCECAERQIRVSAGRRVGRGIPKRYRGVSFDRQPICDLDPSLLRGVRHYVRELAKNLDKGRGLWIHGDVGTGKTSLAMLVSKAALEAGRSVAIYSMPRLLARIRRTYETESGEEGYLSFFDRLSSVDLLHLDDLGAEKRTDWVLEQLYAIVDRRYEEERSMVVTTNLDVPALEEQIGERTVSRLVEICGDPLPLYGDDQRYRIETASPPAPRGPNQPS